MTAVRELNRSEVAAAASLRIAKEGTNTITERRKAAIQHAKKANKILPHRTSYSEARTYLRGPDRVISASDNASGLADSSPSRGRGRDHKSWFVQSKKKEMVSDTRRGSIGKSESSATKMHGMKARSKQ